MDLYGPSCNLRSANISDRPWSVCKFWSNCRRTHTNNPGLVRQDSRFKVCSPRVRRSCFWPFETRIRSVLYADDVVLFASVECDLQLVQNVRTESSKRWSVKCIVSFKQHKIKPEQLDERWETRSLSLRFKNRIRENVFVTFWVVSVTVCVFRWVMLTRIRRLQEYTPACSVERSLSTTGGGRSCSSPQTWGWFHRGCDWRWTHSLVIIDRLRSCRRNLSEGLMFEFSHVCSFCHFPTLDKYKANMFS